MTVGINACVVPRRSDAVTGVTLTLTEVGVGVGGGEWTTGELVTMLPQPREHPALTSRASVSTAGKWLGGALREQVPAS